MSQLEGARVQRGLVQELPAQIGILHVGRALQQAARALVNGLACRVLLPGFVERARVREPDVRFALRDAAELAGSACLACQRKRPRDELLLQEDFREHAGTPAREMAARLKNFTRSFGLLGRCARVAERQLCAGGVSAREPAEDLVALSFELLGCLRGEAGGPPCSPSSPWRMPSCSVAAARNSSSPRVFAPRWASANVSRAAGYWEDALAGPEANEQHGLPARVAGPLEAAQARLHGVVKRLHPPSQKASTKERANSAHASASRSGLSWASSSMRDRNALALSYMPA